MQDARSRKSPGHPLPPLRPRDDVGGQAYYFLPHPTRSKGDLRVFCSQRCPTGAGRIGRINPRRVGAGPIQSGTRSPSFSLSLVLTVDTAEHTDNVIHRIVRRCGGFVLFLAIYSQLPFCLSPREDLDLAFFSFPNPRSAVGAIASWFRVLFSPVAS